jgi:hypothetical protein
VQGGGAVCCRGAAPCSARRRRPAVQGGTSARSGCGVAAAQHISRCRQVRSPRPRLEGPLHKSWQRHEAGAKEDLASTVLAQDHFYSDFLSLFLRVGHIVTVGATLRLLGSRWGHPSSIMMISPGICSGHPECNKSSDVRNLNG